MATKKKAKKAKAPKKLKTQDALEKASLKSREDCSVLVGTNGPQSPIWQSQSSVSDAGTKLVAAGTTLAAADTAAQKADAAALAAHTTRDIAVVEWDAAYDVYAANVTKYAPTPADVAALALNVHERQTFPLAVPLGVNLKYDAQTSILSVRVTPAPGLKSCEIQISTNPSDPTSWKRLAGNGLKRQIPGLAPATYYVRACSVRADQESDYTTPVPVTVK